MSGLLKHRHVVVDYLIAFAACNNLEHAVLHTCVAYIDFLLDVAWTPDVGLRKDTLEDTRLVGAASLVIADKLHVDCHRSVRYIAHGMCVDASCLRAVERWAVNQMGWHLFRPTVWQGIFHGNVPLFVEDSPNQHFQQAQAYATALLLGRVRSIDPFVVADVLRTLCMAHDAHEPLALDAFESRVLRRLKTSIERGHVLNCAVRHVSWPSTTSLPTVASAKRAYDQL